MTNRRVKKPNKQCRLERQITFQHISIEGFVDFPERQGFHKGFKWRQKVSLQYLQENPCKHEGEYREVKLELLVWKINRQISLLILGYNISLVTEDGMQAALLVFCSSFRTLVGQKLVDGSVNLDALELLRKIPKTVIVISFLF